jgi:transcriptional regulator GlxA family with amidase domain
MEIAVLIGEGVTASDAINPAEVLSSIAGATVKFVGTSRGLRRAIPGRFALAVDHTLDEVPRPDIVLVPADQVSAFDPQVLAWLRAAHETSTWTVSVCGGSVTLAAAGILTGLPATGHWTTPDILRAHGATFVNERWVRSGKVVTAAGNSAGIDMSLWLLGEIAGEDHARATQLLMEYDPQPPFDSGSVAKAGPATAALAAQQLQAMLAAADAPADLFERLAQSAEAPAGG